VKVSDIQRVQGDTLTYIAPDWGRVVHVSSPDDHINEDDDAMLKKPKYQGDAGNIASAYLSWKRNEHEHCGKDAEEKKEGIQHSRKTDRQREKKRGGCMASAN
jgi:hypothetical protein